MSRLTVDAIVKRFGEITAVDNVTFTVGDNEILALVGPSGCGKSTLLRTIAGLHGIDAGRIVVNDETVDDSRHHLPPERRQVGLVFQEHALFPHLTVAANVGFGLANDDSPQHRVVESLAMVGLLDYGQRYPHELSGGERQRVALARAIAPRPRLMLLDEPFASLDPNLRHQIREDVVAILRAEQIPAVFVTHDQLEALAVGDRVAVMNDGRFEQLAAPPEVFHQPTNRFVAAFMGEADFLPITIDNGRVTTEIGEINGSLAAIGLTSDRSTISDCVMMLRPQDIGFNIDSTGTATICHAEFRGSTWCYSLRLKSGALIRSTQPHHNVHSVGTTVRPTITITPDYRPIIF